MLKVQEYLSGGATYDDLSAEFGISVVRHPEEPLAILNYSQIESPKTHPIVRECRGLVLNAENHAVVARSFPRFFNWGEVADEMPLFDFSDFSVQTKEDGSLIIVYKFCGEWRINTRGSFAQDPMSYRSFSWESAILRAMGVARREELDGVLSDDLTYVGEFCSPWNKIVRRYEKPVAYLLTAFRGLDELGHDECDNLAGNTFLRPDRHDFTDIYQVQEFLAQQAETDPTYEGVVIRDSGNRRWKIKSPTYLALHRLKGDGKDPWNPKNMIPFILSGETDELLTYFPEAEAAYRIQEERVNEEYKRLESLLMESQGIEVQKDFALAIQGKTPFSGLLFTLRKQHGPMIPTDALKSLWRQSPDYIVKAVLENVTWE